MLLERLGEDWEKCFGAHFDPICVIVYRAIHSRLLFNLFGEFINDPRCFIFENRRTKASTVPVRQMFFVGQYRDSVRDSVQDSIMRPLANVHERPKHPT